MKRSVLMPIVVLAVLLGMTSREPGPGDHSGRKENGRPITSGR